MTHHREASCHLEKSNTGKLLTNKSSKNGNDLRVIRTKNHGDVSSFDSHELVNKCLLG